MFNTFSQEAGSPLQHHEKSTDTPSALVETIRRSAGYLITGLTVEIRDSSQIVLRGQSRMYYGKQIAQHVAMQEMGGTHEIVNLIVVKEAP